ncbi:hypothetical protein D9758_012061 [Tetrapyrgos nigripes]|uniref:Uncharacterized protein n=1 Tax=Tetrapyrgos nigripes TaxID=182062 RepID=A0A8H5CBT4_9AGAR|nr:hypothetical protein D9758_012061 [Tetrapyrgos nigripes]
MRNLLPLVTLALTGLVAADLFVTEYAVEHPASVDGFEYCQNTHCDRDLWKTLPATRGTAVCDSSVNQIGYRRAGDESTNAIYKCDDSIVPLIFTRVVDDFDFGAHWSVSVSQEWPSAPAKRDFSPVKLNPSGIISVFHTECPDGNNVTITTIDANGVTETIEGVDNLSKPMPDTFPVNATVTISGANGRNGVGQFIVTGDNQIVVQFGGDNGPTLSTNYELSVELCPD